MSAADPTKRVFMSMGDSSDFLKKPEKSAGTGSSKSKTLRLDLDLFEPDEYKFPEFNYKKLVHIEKVILTVSSSFSTASENKKKRKKRIHFFSIYIVSLFSFVGLHLPLASHTSFFNDDVERVRTAA